MLHALEIRNYRGFASLSVEGLTRVSLLVGKNNVGKTSILEAAEVLASGATPFALFRSLTRRAERIPDNDLREPAELDVCHLFHGHELSIGKQLRISGINGKPTSLTCEVEWAHRESDLPVANATTDEETDEFWEDVELTEPLRALRFTDFQAHRAAIVALSPKGGLSPLILSRLSGFEESRRDPVITIPTEGLDTRRLGQLWNEIALTEAEQRVIDALSIIEPDIDRLTFLSGDRRTARAPGEGFFARLKQYPGRIPFGNMGDGMKRLLALSMAVSRAAGGYLFIDEIDTGLHYSTLPDMWRLVVRTAQTLDVQVVATTHSGDCVRALAWLNKSAPDLAQDVTLHKVERGFARTILYSSDELAVAATRHIEVR